MDCPMSKMREEYPAPVPALPASPGLPPKAAPEADDLERWIRELQAGDALGEGSERLYERFWPSLVHFFCNRGLSQQDSEDIAQETMFRVYQGIGGFRFQASFPTWLFRIARNVSSNRARDRKTQKRAGQEVSLEVVAEQRHDGASTAVRQLADRAPGPFEHTETGERKRALHRAMGELPPKMRAAVLLYGEGYTTPEIAALLRVKTSTVKSQLRDAKKRLKQRLA